MPIYFFIFILNFVSFTAFAKLNTEILIDRTDVVWGFDFLDKDNLIFTEKSGRLFILNTKNTTLTPISDIPAIAKIGQGGLLDIKIHPTDKNLIYISYVQKIKEQYTTALAEIKLSKNFQNDYRLIYSANALSDNSIHFGSRIEFDDKQNLYLSIGDRDEREKAQDLNFDNGKILKFDKNWKKSIYSLGHRNPQGLYWNNITKELWSAEFGPRGGDELNLIEESKNYGWPIITYGREYYGPSIGEGTSKPGLEQPIAYWVPSISPSAISFYTGTKFKNWTNNVFLACLGGSQIRRLDLQNNKVVEQESLLSDKNWRFRNIKMGPDEFLYFSTDDGKIGRITN